MLEIHENRKRYVYGAGFAGKVVAGYLNFCLDSGVEALVVSDNHKEMDMYEFPHSLEKRIIPVIEYSQLPKSDEPIDFYVTLDKGKTDVISMLNSAQCGGVIDVSPFIEEIIDEYNRFVCQSYGISLEDEYLNFNGVKITNYLMKEKKLKKTFWETYGDEILPSVYKDNSLSIDGPYEIETLNVNIQNGDVIFDIGANLGLFSCYAAQKGCEVYAFDPDETCLKLLREQQERYKNLNVIPLGLSNETGKKAFYESEDCALSSMSRLAEGKLIKKEVEIDTLDHYVESTGIRKIDYIKADIEGEERNMLRGAVKVLKEMHPKLAICTYHYPEDPELLEKIILDANPNYIINHSWRKLYAYVPE